MLIGSILFIILLMFIIIMVEIQSRKAGTIPAPTWAKTRNHMISMLPEKPDGDILDLGCGWGGALFALSKRYPEHKIIGYEITFLPYWISLLRIFLSRRKNIQLLQKDFMAESFKNAGAIFCYLPDKHMKKLEPKFIEELKDTAAVVSHSFPLPNIPPTVTEIIKEGFWFSTIYLYRQPTN